MKSNALEKSKNSSVASRFFVRTPSMIRRIVEICEVTIEKQGIVNLSSHSSKSYDSVVLCDSVVVFLGKGKDATFCLFFYCVFVYRLRCIIGEVGNQILLSSKLQRYFVEVWSFLFQFFQNCVSFFFRLMSSWSLIIFEMFVSDFKGGSVQIFEVFFLLVKFFFLASSSVCAMVPAIVQ